MSMNREQLIRICLNSGVVRRDVAINLIEIIENNIIEEANKRANAGWTLMCEKMVATERQRCVDVCNNLEIEGSMSYGSICANAIQEGCK